MDTPERKTDAATTKRRLNSSIVAAGVAFGITLAGLGVAAAQTDDSSSGADGSTEATKPARVAETELTGDVAEKVKAAALAAVPGGTIIRVETDSDGSPYEAHVRKADGTEVVVKVDAGFTVTATEAGGGGGRGDHHGGRGGPGGPPATLTGDVADKVTSAALVAVPGGTIVRVQAGPEGGYHAHVTNSDGTEVVVTLDGDFKVTGTVDGAAFGFGGGHHGRGGPDDGATGTD